MWCWGAGAHGQLGSGTGGDLGPGPVEVADLGNIWQLDSGGSHTCARRADGRALCWGTNARGQLGDGTTADHDTPAVVPGLVGFTAPIHIDLAHQSPARLAVMSDGTGRTWGTAKDGILGDAGPYEDESGKTLMTATPVKLAVPGLLVRVWGSNVHACGLTADGTMYCWGDGGNGRLGTGTPFYTAAETSIPMPVLGIDAVWKMVEGDTSGDDYPGAIRADGQLFLWGSHIISAIPEEALLALGPPLPEASAAIPVPEVTGLVSLTSGGRSIHANGTPVSFKLASVFVDNSGLVTIEDEPADLIDQSTASLQLTTAGHVYAAGFWAPYFEGSSASGKTLYDPVLIDGFADVIDIDKCYKASSGLRADGTILMWGKGNILGETELESSIITTEDYGTTVPIPIPEVTQVECAFSGCALTADGEVWCWGSIYMDTGPQTHLAPARIVNLP